VRCTAAASRDSYSRNFKFADIRRSAQEWALRSSPLHMFRAWCSRNHASLSRAFEVRTGTCTFISVVFRESFRHVKIRDALYTVQRSACFHPRPYPSCCRIAAFVPLKGTKIWLVTMSLKLFLDHNLTKFITVPHSWRHPFVSAPSALNWASFPDLTITSWDEQSMDNRFIYIRSIVSLQVPPFSCTLQIIYTSYASPSWQRLHPLKLCLRYHPRS